MPGLNLKENKLLFNDFLLSCFSLAVNFYDIKPGCKFTYITIKRSPDIYLTCHSPG